MFQAIIEDRDAPEVEKSIDRYSGFLFYDDNGMPLGGLVTAVSRGKRSS